MRAWIGHLVAAAASVVTMGATAKLATRIDLGMPHQRPTIGPPDTEPLPLLLTGGIWVAAAGLLLLRVRPRLGFTMVCAGLVLYGLTGGPGFGMFVPASVGAALLVARSGLRSAAPFLALVPLALWSPDWTREALGTGDLNTWRGVVTGTVWALLPALAVSVVASRRQAAARERADALERAASDERLRLAREIHDVVGHSLSMISLQSAVALRVLDADPGQARASLEAIRGASKDALAELRHTLGVFRGDEDVPRAPTPTLAAVARLVADVRASGVTVDLAPLPDADGLGAAEQAAAYRIVQESLTNAVRHAPGRAVSVRVERGPTGLDLRIVNDLSPDAAADAPLSEGGGLRGMRERATALGGTFRASREGGRFVVAATLPTDQETA
ncbi:sensor histidine kinase [Propioniciclava coleopterorum]|uniref:histidine kinase n=1 Tax=Propioniciclava coleopterorum TaxID=2714937 RepID=A0A6G7Y5K5_9ACTN|nr:histidine kinase [Propioniciclava coleopterorum]QIK72095.1 sensor histidine kinase [Propioniciclava coleopterorum]